MQRSRDRAAPPGFRSVAVAAVSTTLAVAAHGVGGGAAPDGTGVLLLVGLATVLAAAARSVPGLSTSRTGLLALLGAGQLGGHLMLAVSSHHHGEMTAAMLGAHVAAVGVCAVLIAFAERIGPRCTAALSRTLPRLLCPPPPPVRVPVCAGVCRCVDVPTQRSAVLAASIGRRGPPLV